MRDDDVTTLAVAPPTWWPTPTNGFNVRMVLRARAKKKKKKGKTGCWLGEEEEEEKEEEEAVMVVVVVVAVGALLRQCECTQQLRHQEKEEGGRSLSFNLPPVGRSVHPSVPLPTHRPTDPPFPALHTDFWGRPLWYYFGWFG